MIPAFLFIFLRNFLGEIPLTPSKEIWCGYVASAAIQLRKLVVRSTKSPAGAVQSAQWRELDLSSSRAPAKFPVVMRCPVGSRNFVPRPLAVGTAAGGKDHEGSAAGESHLHPGKQVCRLLRSWCRCVASAAIQLRKLVVRSTKSPAGAVQTAQWRELDLSSSRAPAEFPVVMRCPVGSRTFGARPLAVGTAAGGKEHEGCAADESHLYPGKPALPPRKISLISGYGSP